MAVDDLEIPVDIMLRPIGDGEDTSAHVGARESLDDDCGEHALPYTGSSMSDNV